MLIWSAAKIGWVSRKSSFWKITDIPRICKFHAPKRVNMSIIKWVNSFAFNCYPIIYPIKLVLFCSCLMFTKSLRYREWINRVNRHRLFFAFFLAANIQVWTFQFDWSACVKTLRRLNGELITSFNHQTFPPK